MNTLRTTLAMAAAIAARFRSLSASIPRRAAQQA
jgi:hypothetical protein